MKNWQEMQEKAKKMIESGLKIMKEGVKDAEIVAGGTASAAKLHLNVQQGKFELYRSLHDLGRVVYENHKKMPEAGSVAMTNEVKILLAKVAMHDSAIHKAEKDLGRLSIVKKGVTTQVRHKNGKNGAASKK